MRLTRALLLGVAAVVVALPSGSALQPVPVVDDRLVPDRPRPAAVPEQVSFDDLQPGSSLVEQTAPPTASPRPRARTTPTSSRVAATWPAAGSPQAVLAAAYRHAVAEAPPACHLEVAHLAAIGQVESGSAGGRTIGPDHRVSPAIYGPLLDGGPFAVVPDSDGGRYDGDTGYDRAVGPLQFLPGTWVTAGRDGDADGVRDPQNVFDAALATAGYLCGDGRDLALDADLRSAVLSYNASEDYLDAVLQWVAHFRRHGLGALGDVAFLVASGGRASDLDGPEEVVTPPQEDEAATSTAASGGNPSSTRRPGPTTGTPTTTATPTATATSTATAPTPTTTTSTPAPSPTTTATPTPSTTTSTTTTATPTTTGTTDGSG